MASQILQLTGLSKQLCCVPRQSFGIDLPSADAARFQKNEALENKVVAVDVPQLMIRPGVATVCGLKLLHALQSKPRRASGCTTSCCLASIVHFFLFRPWPFFGLQYLMQEGHARRERRACSASSKHPPTSRMARHCHAGDMLKGAHMIGFFRRICKLCFGVSVVHLSSSSSSSKSRIKSQEPE